MGVVSERGRKTRGQEENLYLHKSQVTDHKSLRRRRTYMLARYYTSGSGRFLQVDPGYDYAKTDPMSFNLYVYVRGNPILSFDPSGEFTVFCNGIGGNLLPRGAHNDGNVMMGLDFDPEGGKPINTYQNGLESTFQTFVVNTAMTVMGGFEGDVMRMANTLVEESKVGHATLNVLGHSGGGIVALRAAWIAVGNGAHINSVFTIASPVFSFIKHRLRKAGVKVRSYYVKSDPVSWLAALVDFVTGDWKNLFNKSNWISTSTVGADAHREGIGIAASSIFDDISATAAASGSQSVDSSSAGVDSFACSVDSPMVADWYRSRYKRRSLKRRPELEHLR